MDELTSRSSKEDGRQGGQHRTGDRRHRNRCPVPQPSKRRSAERRRWRSIAPVTLVSGIVFNGYVSAKDRATGKPIRPLLISTHATRDEFAEILLDEPELDPVQCLRGYLNAVVSPHPYDFEAVRPVVQFDLSKYKFVEEMDVVAGFDSRPNLLALKPVEFEHLIRQLFEGIGLKSWVTQASRDEGVDGVAVNEDPIVGGLCIIQAKRYSKIVGLEAVHALAGVMEDKSAAKGVLVTTSWVGKASRDFAARNGRIEIIEGRHLKAMLLEHLGMDALIGLPHLMSGRRTFELRRPIEVHVASSSRQCQSCFGTPPQTRPTECALGDH